ncbi:ABC transporter substrate-binding protein [Thermodesulfobacteriota bacterium]
MEKKYLWLIIVILIAGMFTVPISPKTAQGSPSGELTIALPTLYDQTMHPNWATMYRKYYLEVMYDYIIGVDENGKFDPKQGIAYKWEVAPDNLSWTFYIRDGVKFHNGDKLTNEDVKYTIEGAVSKKNNGGNQSDFRAHIDKVETAPPDKVIVHLKKPWPTFEYFISILTATNGMVVPKNYIEKNGDKHFLAHPVGSGPYKFLDWKEGDYVKYEALDSHWRVGVPKYKYITFKLMPEAGTREAALRAGEVDIIKLSVDRVKGIKSAGLAVLRKKESIFLGLGWIQDFRPEFPTNKKKVRQALIYAINKKELLDQIMLGEGDLVGSSYSMFTWAIEYKPYPVTPYDPKKAKELLAEAGYPNGFTMYIYSFVTGLPETKLIAEAIAGYWDAIGINIKILEMEYSAFRPVWTKQQDPPGPAAFILAWPNRPVYSWRSHYHSTAKFSHKKIPEMDRLIEDFEKKTTKDEYIAAARKNMDYVLENYLSTGIFTTNDIFGARNDVPNWNKGKGTSSFRWEYIGSQQ